MTGFNEGLANDGKLKLSWDATRPVHRDDAWQGVEEKARQFVKRKVLDSDLILDMLGLKLPD
jgi:hypothetical protein